MALQAILIFVWLAFYIAPFALIIISWNFRSFVTITSVVFAFLAYNWITHTDVTSMQKEDWGWGITDIILRTAWVGLVVGASTHSITLARGWQRFERPSLIMYLFGLAVPVALTAVYVAYHKWA